MAQAVQVPTIHLTRMKSIYTMLPSTMKRFNKRGIPTTCHYHIGLNGAEIEVGQRVYAANKSRTRATAILSHLECALRASVILESELG